MRIGFCPAALLALPFVATGCGDTPVKPAGPAVSAFSGDRQTGAPAHALLEPLAVTIRDDDGRSKPGVMVYWRPLNGGSVDPDSSLTNPHGVASTKWTLGNTEGIQEVDAITELGTVSFKAVATSLDLTRVTPLTLETPEGSGQTVHPDFVRAQTPGLPGDYLVITPYPNGNSSWENPSLFTSMSPIDWSVPAGASNPIVQPTGDEYLSDPDAVLVPETGELWVYYRAVASRNVIRLVRTTDGIHHSAPVTVVTAPNHEVVSPAIVRRSPTAWLMWSVNANIGCSAPNTTVEVRSSTDGLTWSEPRTVRLEQAGFYPWHIEVQWIPSRSEFWALYNGKVAHSCTTHDLFLATSRDGLTWTTFPSPILTSGEIPALEDVVYRSTFHFDAAADAIDFWYSGARYDGGQYIWSSAYQRRTRSEVFTTAARPFESRAAGAPRNRSARHVPELIDPP